MRRVFLSFSKMRVCRRCLFNGWAKPSPTWQLAPRNRGGRRGDYGVSSLAPPSCALRQSSAASSWLPELPEEELALLLASDPEPWPTSWFPESSPWRTTRRLRRVVARAPLLRTEAVLSRILLAAVAARRGVRSFACIGS